MDDQVIDITDLTKNLTDSFIIWAVTYAFNGLSVIPGFSWIQLPLISDTLKAFLNIVFTRVANSPVMQAFFINTALRKYSQAKDYVDTIAIKNQLPPNVSNDIYRKAELDEMRAFYNFVRLDN